MELCKYGCGREGKYQFKKSRNKQQGEWCCSKNVMLCPAIKKIHQKEQKKRNTKVEVVCAWCSKNKKVDMRYYKKAKRFFCTNNSDWGVDSCRAKWDSIHKKGKNSPSWNGGKKIVNCTYCGKPKKVRPGLPSGNNFCDLICQGKWQAENMRGKNSPAWRGGGVEVVCAYCGKIKEIPKAWAKRRKHFFCNREHQGAWVSLNGCGENSPTWRGGIKAEPYCQVWVDKEFKNYIKGRDEYRCQNPDCWGTANHLPLVVMHINNNKKDCHPDNLITGCHSCNGRAQKDREWHTSWYQAIMHRQGKLLKNL